MKIGEHARHSDHSDQYANFPRSAASYHIAYIKTFLYSLIQTQVALQHLWETVSTTHSLCDVHIEGEPSIPKVHPISEACWCIWATT